MRISLLDYKAMVAQSLKVGLDQQGYFVDVARISGESGEIRGVHHHDAILLPVMLGDFDGIELCRRLRRRKVAARSKQSCIGTVIGRADRFVEHAGTSDSRVRPGRAP